MQQPLRILAVALALLGGGATLLAGGVRLAGQGAASLRAAPHLHPAEQLILVAAGAGLAAVGAWVCVGTIVCLADLLRRPHLGRPGFLRPRAVQHALRMACAPALGAVVVCAGPAAADTGDHSVLDGLPLPERPVVTSSTATPEPRTGSPARLGSPSPARSLSGLTVRPGDSLWAIADDLLPTGVPAAAVDRTWRLLYDANRTRIGPDPDVVHPGTPLAVPRSLRPSLPTTR